jgi:hypothetical protein
MKRIGLIALALLLSGCASRQLTPEMERITSVSDTSGCRFVQKMYTETQPYNMIHYVQLNTGNAGGDAYKIIATNNQMVMGVNVMMVNFEVYKCRTE